MKTDAEPQWKRLVTPGHTWVARLDAMTGIGVAVVLVFALSLTRDIHGNTVGLAEKMSQVSTEPASGWERFVAAPIETLKGAMKGERVARGGARPQLDYAAVAAIAAVPANLTFENLTAAGDLKTYIDDNVRALNGTGKLSADYPACDKLDDLRKPWVNGATGTPDIPRCLTSSSGDTIWMASIIGDGTQWAMSAAPWLGVFHRTAEGWAYYNVQNFVPAGRFGLRGYKAVSFDLIPYQIARDFPYLIAQEVSDESAR